MTGEQMRLADMKVEDDEDFEKIILAYDYSTKHGSRYQVIEEGGLVESGEIPLSEADIRAQEGVRRI